MPSIRYTTKTALDGTPLPVLSLEGPVDVTPEALARALAASAQEQGAAFFLLTSRDPIVLKAMSLLHATVVNTLCYFRLHRSKAREDAWLENESIRQAEVTLSFHEYVPEHLYAPVAALMTELMNDITREHPQERFGETAEGIAKKMTHFRDNGIRMPLFLLSDPQERLVGLSFVLVDPRSSTAKQELTGVTEAFRGRKLAYFLKALTIRETFDRHPHVESLETNCYSVNAPILHINRAMGYVPAEQGFQYRVALTPAHPLL